MSINAVYTTLDRLESKGFLKSWVGDPTPQRGGRRRKFYALRPAGVAALRQAYRAFTAMADGLQSRLETEVKRTTDPPRLAIWLLTRRLSAEWRDFVVGDLEEEFATRSADSPVAAPRLVLVADDALPGCAATRSPQSIAAWNHHKETPGCARCLPIFVMRSG